MLAYLNARFIEKSDATVSVDDRGFIFGDGIYEVVRAVDGRLLAFDRHMRRLERGLSELAIRGGDDATPLGIRAIAERLLRENGLTQGNATIYVQITRGAAPRTHFFPPGDVPATVYATATRLAMQPGLVTTGARAISVPDARWLRCDIKTIQLLPNVLAKQAAVAVGAFEAILVRDGVITEGSSTSVFAVIDGALRTHPATSLILPGVRRAMVLELAAAHGVPVLEEAITRSALRDVAELFITSTTNDVLPIVRVDDTRIGDGLPGPTTRHLAALLQAQFERETVAPAGRATAAGSAASPLRPRATAEARAE